MKYLYKGEIFVQAYEKKIVFKHAKWSSILKSSILVHIKKIFGHVCSLYCGKPKNMLSSVNYIISKVSCLSVSKSRNSHWYIFCCCRVSVYIKRCHLVGRFGIHTEVIKKMQIYLLRNQKKMFYLLQTNEDYAIFFYYLFDQFLQRFFFFVF